MSPVDDKKPQEHNTVPVNDHKKISILLEMRPAMEGFAGIPQEVRLLFKGLCELPHVTVEGMIQSPHRMLGKGTAIKQARFGKPLSAARRFNRMSKAVISLSEDIHQGQLAKITRFLNRRFFRFFMSLFVRALTLKMTRFETEAFEDFIWRNFFSRTLPSSDFNLVTRANFRICSIPWKLLHDIGIARTGIDGTPIYPVIETDGIDVFIGQTPYPGRVNRKTAMVIRYHDAIPVFMPHTIPEKTRHQTTHFKALYSNVRNKSWFACVSEATRQDLLRIHPEAAARSVTIHNMVSQHYFDETSKPERVPEIIRARLYEASGFLPKFLTIREKERFYASAFARVPLKFLLMVSTIEPRKNHLRLLAAWEVIKAEIDPTLKLVIVGTLGWDNGAITSAFKPWIDRGDLFMLNAVPAPDLRVLYKHAAATVCPSLGEGFDYSGAEAMTCGGVTVASDIPVHREVYGDAAEFFNPYATSSLVQALKAVLYDDAAPKRRADLIAAGHVVAERYKPQAILPQWERFLDRVMQEQEKRP